MRKHQNISRGLNPSFLMFLVLLASCKHSNVKPVDIGYSNTKAENYIDTTMLVSAKVASDNVNMKIVEKQDLNVYYPAYKRIELICGTMPSPNDKHVLMVCEAAFTGKCLNDFKHGNIAGNHVSGGVYYNGYRCKLNTGCFAWYGDNRKWIFAMDDYNKYMIDASRRNGMAFGQNMVIFNHKVQPVKAQKQTRVEYFRVLAELNGKLCVIDSPKKMEYKDFVSALMAENVKHALYLDMGKGWNYSFYRDNEENIHYIHDVRCKYATNWVTFYK